MSVAHQLNYSRTIQGTAVRQPEVDPERGQRPAPRPRTRPAARRLPWGLFGAIGGLWIGVVAIAIAIVHINGQVSREVAAITGLREEMAIVEQKNLELEGQLAQATSVAAVEKWAVARGMKRPESLSRLKAGPAALAVKPAPVSPPAPAAAEPAGIWGALKSYIGQMTGALHLVGSPR